MIQKQYRVDIIESERGYGQKLLESKYFKTYDLASEYINKFNSKNTESKVPDWYMYATGPIVIEFDTFPIGTKIKRVVGRKIINE